MIENSHRLDMGQGSHNMTNESGKVSGKKRRRHIASKPLNDFEREVLIFMAKKGPVSQTEISEKLRTGEEMDFSYIHRTMISLERLAYIKVGDIIKSAPGNDAKIYHLTVGGFYSALLIGNLWDEVDEVFEKWREPLAKIDPILIGKWKHYCGSTMLKKYLVGALKMAINNSRIFPGSFGSEDQQADLVRFWFFRQVFEYPMAILNSGYKYTEEYSKKEIDYYELWAKVIQGDQELMNWITDFLMNDISYYVLLIKHIQPLLQLIKRKDVQLKPMKIYKDGETMEEVIKRINKSLRPFMI